MQLFSYWKDWKSSHILSNSFFSQDFLYPVPTYIISADRMLWRNIFSRYLSYQFGKSSPQPFRYSNTRLSTLSLPHPTKGQFLNKHPQGEPQYTGFFMVLMFLRGFMFFPDCWKSLFDTAQAKKKSQYFWQWDHVQLMSRGILSKINVHIINQLCWDYRNMHQQQNYHFNKLKHGTIHHLIMKRLTLKINITR